VLSPFPNHPITPLLMELALDDSERQHLDAKLSPFIFGHIFWKSIIFKSI
jgi:hypothetical protein